MKPFFIFGFLLFCSEAIAYPGFTFKTGELKLLTDQKIAEWNGILDSIYNNSDYELQFNFETHVLNRLKADSSSQFEKLDQTLKKKSDKFHQKNSDQNKTTIIFHFYGLVNQKDQNSSWNHYIFQFVSLDQQLPLAKKIKLSQLKKPFSFQNEASGTNSILMDSLINAIIHFLKKPPNVFEKMKLGPLEVEFIEDLKVQDSSSASGTVKTYASTHIRFELNFVDEDFKYRNIRIDSAAVSLKISKNMDQITDIRIFGQSRQGIQIGSVKGINFLLKSFSLKLHQQGSDQLMGDAQFQAVSDRKVKLYSNLFLLPGANGEFSFQFQEGTSTSRNGQFNFQGIKNISLALLAQDQEILTIEDGKLDSLGNFEASINLKDTVDLKFDAFKVSIPAVSGSLKYSFRGNSEISNFRSILVVDASQDTNSRIIVHLEADSLQNIVAKVDSASSIRFNGLSLTQLDLNIKIKDLFYLEELTGSATATHPSFDNQLKINHLLIRNGEVSEIDGQGYVRINNFDFEIENFSYSDKKMKLNAKVMLNTTGTESWVATKDFCVNENGSVSIGEISAALDKDPFRINFSATWKENGFAGNFNGEFAGIEIEGRIDLGAAKSEQQVFNYAYLKLNAGSNTGIPVGATGLKVTKIGGEVGYNYLLIFNQEDFSQSPTGNPEYDQYLIGCTLALCDAAGFCEVEGNVLVQFGQNKFQLLLAGQVSIPQKNPIITSGISLLYEPAANLVSGELNTQIKIPPENGLIFNTPKLIAHFRIEQNSWSFTGNNLRASIINLLSYEGDIVFSGNFKDASVKGRISGKVSYHFNFSFNKSLELSDYELGTISASLDLGLAAKTDLEFDPNHFHGSIEGKIDGLAKLKIDSSIGSFQLTSAVDCQANLELDNKEGLISGQASILLETSIWSHQYDYAIIKHI